MSRRRVFLKWIYVIIIGTGDLFLCVHSGCFSGTAPDYSMDIYGKVIERKTLEYLENVAEFTVQKKSVLYMLKVKKGVSKFVVIADDLTVMDSIFVPSVANIYLVGPPLSKSTEKWILELTTALFTYLNVFYFEWWEIGSLEPHLMARFIVPLGDILSQLIAKVDKYTAKQQNAIVGIGLGCHVANVAAQSPYGSTATGKIITQAYYLDPQPYSTLDYLYGDRQAYVSERAVQYVQLISTTGSYNPGPMQLVASQTFIVNNGKLQSTDATQPAATEQQLLRRTQFRAVDVFCCAISKDMPDDSRKDIVGYFSYGKPGVFSLTIPNVNSIC